MSEPCEIHCDCMWGVYGPNDGTGEYHDAFDALNDWNYNTDDGIEELKFLRDLVDERIKEAEAEKKYHELTPGDE